MVLKKGRDLLEMMLNDDEAIKTSYFSRPGQLSDEPLWGIGLAQTDVDVPEHNYGALLQLTSPNTTNHQFDFAGRKFHARKGGIPKAKGEIYHFAAMNPLDGYLDGTRFYREQFDIPLPNLVSDSGTVLTPEQWMRDVKGAAADMMTDTRPTFQFALAE